MAARSFRKLTAQRVVVTAAAVAAVGIFGEVWKTVIAEEAYQKPAEHSAVFSADPTKQKAARATAKELQNSRVGSLYIWGDNSFGLHPETTDILITQPRAVSFFDGKVLSTVSLGRLHAAAIDQNGDVYQWGTAQILPNESAEAAQAPRILLKGYNATDIFCGPDKTYVVTKTGQLFAIPMTTKQAELPKQFSEQESFSFLSWLTNAYQTLTQTVQTLPSLPVPPGAQELLLPTNSKDRIAHVDGGLHHIIVLTKQGKVFSGAQDKHANDFGQLGLGHTNPLVNPVNSPQQELVHVRDLDNQVVTDIACGSTHSVALTQDGSIYTFGSNNFCQLGLGPYHTLRVAISTPTRINTPQKDSMKCTSIAAGGDNTMFILSGPKSNQAFAVGLGLFGQLGTGQWQHMQGDASKIKTISDRVYFDEQQNKVRPIPIKYITVGFRHAAAVLDTMYSDVSGEDVFAWGYNKYHQLGLGHRANAPSPQQMASIGSSEVSMRLSFSESKLQQKIVCGYDTTAVFTTHRN